MTSISLSVTDVARHFSEYINRVTYRGDRFVLLKSGKEVAELKPIPRGRRLSDLAAVLKTSVGLTAEEADAFERDVDVARTEMNQAEVSSPWDS